MIFEQKMLISTYANKEEKMQEKNQHVLIYILEKQVGILLEIFKNLL